MRLAQLLRFVLLNGAGVGLGAVVATSCVGVDYPLVAFQCDPSSGNNNCPDTHFCCSDDPAAVDGAKPNYAMLGIDDPAGMPYFSGENNNVGTSGMCVDTGQLVGQGLSELAAANCPIPCNPTWDQAWINDVCGPARVCCQTVAMGPEDCILDNGQFRPISGADIDSENTWAPGDHNTHQDPGGAGCLALAGGNTGSDVFADCVRQLSVADQRGFCMALGAGQTCPVNQPGYIDACTARNSGGAAGGA